MSIKFKTMLPFIKELEEPKFELLKKEGFIYNVLYLTKYKEYAVKQLSYAEMIDYEHEFIFDKIRLFLIKKVLKYMIFKLNNKINDRLLRSNKKLVDYLKSF